MSDPGIAPDEVVLLRPTNSGTQVDIASNVTEIQPLLEAGLPVVEAVMPHTRPQKVEQLSFFGE